MKYVQELESQSTGAGSDNITNVVKIREKQNKTKANFKWKVGFPTTSTIIKSQRAKACVLTRDQVLAASGSGRRRSLWFECKS